MKRSLFILLGAVMLGTAIFAGAYFIAQRTTKMCCAKPADDLSWLQDEFQLGDPAMAQVRALQADYRPKCAAICTQIAAKKQELEASLGSGTKLTAEAQTKVTELAALRAQCQAQMLQHFISVSQVMPPEQGRRYLAEMKRLALGDNALMEHSMSGEMSHEQQP